MPPQVCSFLSIPTDGPKKSGLGPFTAGPLGDASHGMKIGVGPSYQAGKSHLKHLPTNWRDTGMSKLAAKGFFENSEAKNMDPKEWDPSYKDKVGPTIFQKLPNAADLGSFLAPDQDAS